MKLELIALKMQNIKDSINLRLGEIDAGPLGNNPLSDAMTHVMLSQLVREIARKIIDKEIRPRLFSVGKEMMQFAMEGLIQGWEEGDDTCPPYFHINRPFPKPQPDPWFNRQFDETSLNPQPLPPQLFTDYGIAGKEIILAETLRTAASLTTSGYFNEQLKFAGLSLMRGATSEKAYEEYEFRCGSTGPRIPFHKRSVLAEQ